MIITDIEQKIKQKLEAISDFSVVYDYFETKPSWYPYACFEFADFEWSKIDTCTNKRIYTFQLMVFQETSNIDRKEAKGVMYSIIQKVVEAFDSDQYLWWIADNSTVTKWELFDGNMNDKWEWMFTIINLSFDTTLYVN